MQRSWDFINSSSSISDQIYKWCRRNNVKIRDVNSIPIPYYDRYFEEYKDSKFQMKIENNYVMELSEKDFYKILEKEELLNQYTHHDIPLLRSIIEEKVRIEELCKNNPTLAQAKNHFELLLKMVK